MLNIYFLGKLKFEFDGVDITEKMGNKTAALVAILMLQQNKDISREKIIAYLWPDSNEEAAKYNLRYNLWLLKKILMPDDNGEQFLKIDKEYCSINSKYSFNCDILGVLNFAPNKNDTISKLEKLKKLFRGDFFEGHYFNNCDDFNELIIFERNNFENISVRVAKRLAELYEQQKNYEACLEIINEILDMDPYDESVALKAMSLYTFCGNRSGAIRFYKNFSSKLLCSLGIQPSELLQNKYEKIKQSTNIESNEINLKSIDIDTSCLKAIEYFWIVDVIDEILKKGLFKGIDTITKEEIEDLAYIIPNIAIRANINYDRNINVPSVRIIKAFTNLIKNLCRKHILIIKVNRIENIDDISNSALECIKKLEDKNLIISS